MLQLRSIQPDTLELLKKIQELPCAQNTRLVGGTALALQYGHRQSIDLDFFGTLSEDAEQTANELRSLGTLNILKASPHIHVYMLDGIKIDFVDYSRYPWIDDVRIIDGIRLASPCDIAAMKINAVEGRGTKKDFIDIYALLQHYSLTEILDFYNRKYPEHSTFRALMSLTYFDDADSQIPPLMFDMPEWQDIKDLIRFVVSSFKG